MESGYLVDTNIVIEFTAGKLSEEARELLVHLSSSEIFTSIIVKIEALGFEALPDTMLALRKFIHNVTVLPLTDEVAAKTIHIRKVSRIKLPDAIIAATAIVHNLTLVTRNQKDFKAIEGLRVLPF